jgi:uncharacterized protein YecE (DUF72 family)
MSTAQQLNTPSIRIGCSGWQYPHWRGDFYPSGLASTRWLEHYASRFDTVEINNTFYRLPEAAAFEAWRRRTPPGFLFAVKASRYLTHMKKLKDPAEPLDRLFARARHLGNRFGPVLYQLPPHWPLNLERLGRFLESLPRGHRQAMEFREPSWYCDAVFRLLEGHHVALCLHDMRGSASGRLAVGPFVYVRFHGSAGYTGRYAEEALRGWADWLAGRARDGAPVFAYFNNDAGGHAPHDAMRLRQLVDRAMG